MQTSYFWAAVWNISVSSEVLGTFEFTNRLTAAGVLDVLRPEPGKLCYLVKLSEQSDENRNV